MFCNKGLNLRMACNRLRIDPNNGSPVLEYRIEHGFVERRTLATDAPEKIAAQGQWQRFTPDQLAALIIASSVFAQWLYYRLGTRAVLPTSSPHLKSGHEEGQEILSREAVLRGVRSFEAITASYTVESLFSF
jgi:hypothetical protein